MEVEVCVSLPAGVNPDKWFCFRAEALELFKTSPFFATWDSLSLELYVECQLWENKETGEAKLKMSGTWVCDRPSLFYYFVVLIPLHRRAQRLPVTADPSRRGILYRYSTSELH